MYKVFIADDEEIIRNGLCRSVPYGELGLELVGAAEDGEQALAEIRRLAPDIVMTDIQMPHLDGLNLIAAVKETLPQCKFVLITGYSEFEYARTALKLGVKEYILKPIQLPELHRTLARLCAELDQENENEETLRNLRKQIESDQMLMEQRLFRRFITHRVSSEDFLNGIAPELKAPCCGVGLLLQLDHFDQLTVSMDEEQIFSLSQEVERELLKQAGGERLVMTDDIGDCFFIMLLCEQPEEARFRIVSYLRRLRINLTRYSFTSVITGVFPGITYAPQAYEQAQKEVERAFVSAGAQDIYVEEQQESAEKLPKQVDVSGALRSLSTFNKEQIWNDFVQVQQDIAQNKHNSFLYTRMVVSVVYSEVVRILTLIHCPIQDIIDDPTAVYKRILSCQTLPQMMKELYRFVSDICDFVNHKGSANQSVVEHAKVYIAEHYRDAGLTLDMVAAKVGISPNYLSALFKQSTGQAFINYVTLVRIEQAKRMIASGDCLSYEVARACGYENATYFSTIFKKYVGMAPSEYKKTAGR